MLESFCFVCWSSNWEHKSEPAQVHFFGTNLLTSSTQLVIPAGCCCSTCQGRIDTSSSNLFHMYWIKLAINTALGKIGLTDKRAWKMCLVLLELHTVHCLPTHWSGLPVIPSTLRCAVQLLWMHSGQCFKNAIRKGRWQIRCVSYFYSSMGKEKRRKNRKRNIEARKEIE